MSRRSLRIHDSLLDRSLPHSTASFSVGGTTTGRKTRSVSSRRLSSTCSESLLLHTPRKPAPVCSSLNSSLVNSSGVHSVAASDASLLSSLLDESSIQESTSVDGFWGLDSDTDPKESTMLCESTILADSTVIAPDSSCLTDSKHSGPSSESSCSSGSIRPVTRPGHGPETRQRTKPEIEQGTEPGPRNSEDTSTIYYRGRKHKGTPLLWIWSWLSWLQSVLLGLKEALQKLELTGRYCVSVMESSFKDKRTNGAVCADCRGLPLRETVVSLLISLMGVVWSAVVFTGAAAARAFTWVRGKWSQMNKDEKRRFPLGFVLFLLLLFAIVFSLLWCGLSSVSVSHLMDSELPFLQTLTSGSESTKPRSTESQNTNPDSASDLESVDPGSVEPGLSGSTAVQTYEEPKIMESEQKSTEDKFLDLDSSRFERLEQSLSSLWKQIEVNGHDCGGEAQNPDSDLSSVLEKQLELIRTKLEHYRRLWEQTRAHEEEQQQSHSLRLERIEQQLNELSKRTLDLEMKTAAVKDFSDAVPAPFGSEVESKDVLFSEMSRLKGALHSVRQELQTLSGCRGTCSQLQNLQETVSALIQEQVWTLVFGTQVWSGLDSVSKPLVQFMSERFVSEQSLQGALSDLEHRILEQQQKSEDEHPPAGDAVTHQEVHRIVQKALRQFSEDRTGLADFALESGGGSIVSTRCSQTFETKAALLSLFGIPLWYFSQSPRTVIQPDVHPGNCWAFRGSRGEFVIRLSSRILPSGFTLEHIPQSLSPTGSLQSAPKDFSVYGLRSEEEEEGTLLGTYLYDEDGEAVQTYTVTEENDEPFQFILVKVLSNWGHMEYTCVYRFRVHGTQIETQPESETETERSSEPGLDQAQTQEVTQEDSHDQD